LAPGDEYRGQQAAALRETSPNLRGNRAIRRRSRIRRLRGRSVPRRWSCRT